MCGPRKYSHPTPIPHTTPHTTTSVLNVSFKAVTNIAHRQGCPHKVCNTPCTCKHILFFIIDKKEKQLIHINFFFQFWTFGVIDKDKQKAWERDSRPMANYGLVLR